MPADLWALYPLMLRSRLFEEAIAKLWHEGLISGEMHLGTGEEAIIAGIGSSRQMGCSSHKFWAIRFSPFPPICSVLIQSCRQCDLSPAVTPLVMIQLYSMPV
jgi:hypothetical protein